MTQPSRTTETINRDHAAIREIMHQVRELTVPDRATLAVGIIGNLATMMNRAQMTKLLGELEEEAQRVQDVPPARQHDREARIASGERSDTVERTAAASDRNESSERGAGAPAADNDRTMRASGVGRDGVGQAGRGEFRGGRLL